MYAAIKHGRLLMPPPPLWAGFGEDGKLSVAERRDAAAWNHAIEGYAETGTVPKGSAANAFLLPSGSKSGTTTDRAIGIRGGEQPV